MSLAAGGGGGGDGTCGWPRPRVAPNAHTTTAGRPNNYNALVGGRRQHLLGQPKWPSSSCVLIIMATTTTTTGGSVGDAHFFRWRVWRSDFMEIFPVDDEWTSIWLECVRRFDLCVFERTNQRRRMKRKLEELKFAARSSSTTTTIASLCVCVCRAHNWVCWLSAGCWCCCSLLLFSRHRVWLVWRRRSHTTRTWRTNLKISNLCVCVCVCAGGGGRSPACEDGSARSSSATAAMD